MGLKRHIFHFVSNALIGLGAVAAALCSGFNYAQDGRTAYEKTCSTCHAKGVNGAPRTDDAAAWQTRLSKNGYSALFESALKGKGAMPPKGGNAALSEEDVMSAVMHMLRLAASGTGGAIAATTVERSAATPAGKSAKQVDAGSVNGRSTYQTSCAACHATGAAGAPKFGDVAAWASRLGAGAAALHNSALTGKGAMPAKGGNANLADADVKAAVDFMVAQARGPAGTTRSKVEVTPATSIAANDGQGKSVYQATCAACHATGAAGAPKIGDPAAWAARVKAGNTALYSNAVKGKGAMPPKGGNASLTDLGIKAAVDYMLAQLGTPTSVIAVQPGKAVEGAAVASTAPQVVTPTQPRPLAVASAGPVVNNVNSFNRLLPAQGKRNLPPLEDGIHDVANDATSQLQAPLLAYAGLPKSNAGNRIDWVKALSEKMVMPRADKQDQKAEMAVLELNIVREVKGSMPDVVYPHRQHTQWLDCSNCHPAIFIPQKGANQISMASIILGQKCGVCHGKVAFPISECRLCHSKAKDTVTVSTGSKP